MVDIRLMTDRDWEAVWAILEPVFRAGETYPYPSDIGKDEAHRAWVEAPFATFVAVDGDGTVLGTYYIKPNQPGQGGHVCNCGYVVAERARGQGVASAMCRHSQDIARARKFHAMQFNLVVSTNEPAVHLWTRLGFETVGTLPQAFRHPRHGLVDALVMYKRL